MHAFLKACKHDEANVCDVHVQEYSLFSSALVTVHSSLWSASSCSGWCWVQEYSPNGTPVHHIQTHMRTHAHTHGSFKQGKSPLVGFAYDGKKPENPEETRTDTGNSWQLRIEPGTLWALVLAGEGGAGRGVGWVPLFFFFSLNKLGAGMWYQKPHEQVYVISWTSQKLVMIQLGAYTMLRFR